MAKKKPNIIECDGLIMRDPDGKKRLSIHYHGPDEFPHPSEQGAVIKMYDENGESLVTLTACPNWKGLFLLAAGTIQKSFILMPCHMEGPDHETLDAETLGLLINGEVTS